MGLQAHRFEGLFNPCDLTMIGGRARDVWFTTKQVMPGTQLSGIGTISQFRSVILIGGSHRHRSDEQKGRNDEYDPETVHPHPLERRAIRR